MAFQCSYRFYRIIKGLVFFCTLLFSVRSIAATASPVDSLQNQLLKNLPDSLRIRTLASLTASLQTKNIYLTMDYAREGLALAEKNDDTYYKAFFLNRMGVINQAIPDYSKALFLHFQALRLFESINKKEDEVAALNGIGVCYLEIKQFDLSQKYFEEALALSEKLGLKTIEGKILDNLAGLASEQGKTGTAIFYCKKAIEVNEKNGITNGYPLVNLGLLYIQLGQLDKADFYYRKGIAASPEDTVTHYINYYGSLGVLYISKNNFKAAEKYLLKAKVAAENSGSGMVRSEIYHNMAEIYEKLGDFRNAYLYKGKNQVLKDSLINENTMKRIAGLQAKYELDKKDKEIQLLNQKQQTSEANAQKQYILRNFFIVAFLFILIISFALIRNNSLKQKINTVLHEKNELLSEKNTQIEFHKIEIEKTNRMLDQFNKELMKENISAKYEILKSKVNPHFLFNSLTTLSSLILENDKNAAMRYIYRFSELYRMILKTSEQKLVSLDAELKVVDNYLYLQKTRFREGLAINIALPQNIQQVFVPPFSVQMVIENAIKHNIISDENRLEIRLYIDGQDLIVRNNLRKKYSKIASTAVGQKNIMERYKALYNRNPVFTETKNEYIVSLPLLSANMEEPFQVNDVAPNEDVF